MEPIILSHPLIAESAFQNEQRTRKWALVSLDSRGRISDRS